MTVRLIEKTPSKGLGSSGTVRCDACGQEQWFVNPSVQRIRWYKDSHRCGGEGWQSC